MPTNAPKPAVPKQQPFDAFNSSSTGHQRAENRLSGSTSWRQSRSLKLQHQFIGGSCGGVRVSDMVGAGSLDFGKDGRTASGGWVRGAPGLRTGGQRSILEGNGAPVVTKDIERPAKRAKLDRQPTKVVNAFTPFTNDDGSIRESSWTSHEQSPSHLLSPITTSPPNQPVPEEDEDAAEDAQLPPMIFNNLVLYVNGSCGETISDHKLKRIWSEHGGGMSVHLARRTVTHVVVGRPTSNGGSGGGLAGSKIQKEVAKKGGASVKYVTAEWVVDSVKEGKRLPESRYSALSVAPNGVQSIASMFGQKQAKPKNEEG